MKKYLALACVLLCVMTLFGCAKGASGYIVEENGEQVLILPGSKDKVHVGDDYKPYLDRIDVDLLKAAEQKLVEQAPKGQTISFYVSERDGALFLCAEIIVKIDPPTEKDMSGCGIDHDHKILSEPITK